MSKTSKITMIQTVGSSNVSTIQNKFLNISKKNIGLLSQMKDLI
jgi:hypothetical protein